MPDKRKPARKPQITFTVSEDLKNLYEGAFDQAGLNAARLCAAGLLVVLTDHDIRRRALSELARFESAPFESVEDLQAYLHRYVIDGEAGRADAAAAAQAGDEAQRGHPQSRRRTAGR